MRKELLMGAAGLALLLGASGAAWAEDHLELDIEVDFVASKNSAAAYDTRYSNIEQGDGTVAQDYSQAGNSQGPLLQSHEDAIWGGQNATDNGAIADQGNALGESAHKNAVASDDSQATWVNARGAEAAAINDSTAVENGALVGGNGIALGNKADDNAIIGGDGTAITTSGADVADDGSALQIGDNNKAAAAKTDSAAVNGSGTAIATDGGELADNGSNFILGDNNTSAAAEESAVVGRDGTALYVHGDAKLKGNATGLFGADNVVAHSTLEQEVSEVNIAGYTLNENSIAPAVVTTGKIQKNTVEMTGVNLTALNTGIVNQGRSISVSVTAAF